MPEAFVWPAVRFIFIRSSQAGAIIMRLAAKFDGPLTEFLSMLLQEVKDWARPHKIRLETGSLDLCALSIEHPTVDFPHLKTKAWDTKVWIHFLYDKADALCAI